MNTRYGLQADAVKEQKRKDGLTDTWPAAALRENDFLQDPEGPQGADLCDRSLCDPWHASCDSFLNFLCCHLTANEEADPNLAGGMLYIMTDISRWGCGLGVQSGIMD